MKVILCIDEKGGVRFHGRRLSQDRIQRADVLRRFGREQLFMKEETAALYADAEMERIHRVIKWEPTIGKDGWWVCEDLEFMKWKEQLQELVLYRWNRKYPSDEQLSLTLTLPLWSCQACDTFAGSSHPLIHVEHYVKGEM